MTHYISQSAALEFGRTHPEKLTKAFTAGKRLYICVNISDLEPGESFSYLNPKDAPKAIVREDGTAEITILDGKTLQELTQTLDRLDGVTYATLPKGKYDKTVKLEVFGLQPGQAEGLIEDIHYTSQTVTNAGPDGMKHAIQASLTDAQSAEVLKFWEDQGRTQADYIALINKIADIQVRDGAKNGDVYDEKAENISRTRKVSGHHISETQGFAGDGVYMRDKTEVRILASEDYVLQGARTKGDQYVMGKGILVYSLTKEGAISEVRSSAEDHAIANGNFLDAQENALTSLDAVSTIDASAIDPATPETSLASGSQSRHYAAMMRSVDELNKPGPRKP